VAVEAQRRAGPGPGDGQRVCGHSSFLQGDGRARISCGSSRPCAQAPPIRLVQKARRGSNRELVAGVGVRTQRRSPHRSRPPPAFAVSQALRARREIARARAAARTARGGLAHSGRTGSPPPILGSTGGREGERKDEEEPRPGACDPRRAALAAGPVCDGGGVWVRLSRGEGIRPRAPCSDASREDESRKCSMLRWARDRHRRRRARQAQLSPAGRICPRGRGRARTSRQQERPRQPRAQDQAVSALPS